jgi:hypothetical protein
MGSVKEKAGCRIKKAEIRKQKLEKKKDDN